METGTEKPKRKRRYKSKYPEVLAPREPMKAPSRVRPPRRDLSAMGIWDALIWAFRDECARLELDKITEAPSFGTEYVLMQRLKLGTKIDCSGGGGGLNETHEDAEAIAAILDGLPDLYGGKRTAIRVSELARAGHLPDWGQGMTPRYEPTGWNENQHGRTAATELVETEEYQTARGTRVAHNRWCPIMLNPSPATIAYHRQTYADFWDVLAYMRRALRDFGGLREVGLTDDMPTRAPWEN